MDCPHVFWRPPTEQLICLLFAGEGARQRGEHLSPRELPRQLAEPGEVADDHEAEAGVLPQPPSRVERGGPPARS